MIYFLSDAHLGTRVIPDPEAHQQKLVQLLEQMGQDAEEIFLLGDMFDFWYEYLFERHQWSDGQGGWHLPRSKRRYMPFIRTIKHLTEKGIKVHYFIGNHDIWTFGDLERNTGVTVHKQPQALVRQGKQLFLAHGDGLVPQDFMTRLPKDIQKRIRSFMHLRAFFHSPLPQFLYRLLPPACGDAFGYEWARRSRLKEMKHPFPYKGDDKEELVLWANEHKQYDLCVFGHRHVTLHLQRDTLPDVVILGDFFQQFTYAQMKDGQIEIKQLHD